MEMEQKSIAKMNEKQKDLDENLYSSDKEEPEQKKQSLKDKPTDLSSLMKKLKKEKE